MWIPKLVTSDAWIVGKAFGRSTRALPCISRKVSISAFTMGAAGRHTVHTTKRLAVLRELMAQKEHAVGAFVVPSEDQRGSSYRLPADVIFNRELYDQIPVNTWPFAMKGAPSSLASMALQVRIILIKARVLLLTRGYCRVRNRYTARCVSFYRWEVLPASWAAIG
jgi:hypothetical protein